MTIGMDVFTIATAWRAACAIERRCLTQIAGWFMHEPHYEIKQRFGYHAVDHADHVDGIRHRLAHMRGGKPDASIAPAALQAIDAYLDAPDHWCFLRGAYLGLRQALLGHYQAMQAACCPAANAADLRLLRRCVLELEDQILWARTVLTDDPDPVRSEAWTAACLAELISADFLLGQEATPPSSESPAPVPFRFGTWLHFDERIEDRPLMPLAERQQLAHADEAREQFRVFFNEIYAAGILACVLFEAGDQDVPWELSRDFAHHFFDECRHSEFGSLRLNEMGDAPDRCDQVLLGHSIAMPFLHRICYLTRVLEPFYMPRKKPRFEDWTAAGDQRSRLFADHDWSDEINHVRFGTTWLDHLLHDDARDVAVLTKEITAIIENRTGEKVGSLSPF